MGHSNPIHNGDLKSDAVHTAMHDLCPSLGFDAMVIDPRQAIEVALTAAGRSGDVTTRDVNKVLKGLKAIEKDVRFPVWDTVADYLRAGMNGRKRGKLNKKVRA